MPACRLKSGSTWADLGCGQGIFSAALAHLLGESGRVIAMDIDHRSLVRLQRNISSTAWRSQIQPVQGDLRQPLPWRNLDGLLLANVLHFFQDETKRSILASLHSGLKSGGELILVEYNSRRGNPAVPYPLPAEEWVHMLARAGWKHARIQARVRSTFLGQMTAIQADLLQ